MTIRSSPHSRYITMITTATMMIITMLMMMNKALRELSGDPSVAASAKAVILKKIGV